MKSNQITEAQEWQLFELLEGNLSSSESSQLLAALDSDPHLRSHYEALKLTYLQPSQISYPHAQSLKKTQSKKQVFLLASLSIAAAFALLLFYRASAVTQPMKNTQNQVAQASKSSQTPLNIERPNQTQIDQLPTSIHHHRNLIGVDAPTAKTKNQSFVPVGAETTEKWVHPLITATEPHRKVNNVNDSNRIRSTVEVFASQKPGKSGTMDAQNATNSNPIVAALSQRPPKTKKELLQSFYRDARRMVENGHLPHLSVKTVNKDQDWMPEFQVGLTLENNVILTSFNPE
jgi:hypothetical protein